MSEFLVKSKQLDDGTVIWKVLAYNKGWFSGWRYIATYETEEQAIKCVKKRASYHPVVRFYNKYGEEDISF